VSDGKAAMPNAVVQNNEMKIFMRARKKQGKNGVGSGVPFYVIQYHSRWKVFSFSGVAPVWRRRWPMQISQVKINLHFTTTATC